MPCVSLCSSEKDFTWKSAKRSLMNVGRDEQNLAQAVVDGTPSCETVPGPRKAYTQKMRPLSIMLPPDEEVSPPNTPRMQANTKQPIPGPKVRTRASDQSKAKCVERRRVKQLMSVVDTTEGRSFSCNICRKVFSTAARAKKHVAAHLGVRPFKCPVCWKSFNRAQNLEDHMQYHTRGLQLANGGKQNFSSSRSSDRNIEHSVPPRQTLYSCGVCHKQFPTYKDLEVHSIQHNQDNRTLQCKFCNDKFETETLLKEHLKWHEEKQHFHQCARCHLSFYHKEGLNLHILKDHGSALYDVLTAPRRDASTKHHGNRSPDEVKIVSVSEAQTPQNKAIFQRGSQAEKPTLSLQLAQKANNIQATRRLVPAEITAAEALANAWSASSVSSERTSLPEAIRMVCNQCKKPVLSPPVSPTCQSLQLHCNCSSTFQPEQLSPAEMHPQPSTIIPSSSLPLSAVPRPVPSQYQGQLSSNARSSSTLQASRRRPGSTSHRGRPPSSPTHPLLQYPMAATSTSTADPEPEVPKVRRHYKCKICSSTFYKLSEFEKHKTEHDDGRTFMCNSCDENFSTQSEFIRHSKEKHPGKDGRSCFHSFPQHCAHKRQKYPPKEQRKITKLRFFITSHPARSNIAAGHTKGFTFRRAQRYSNSSRPKNRC